MPEQELILEFNKSYVFLMCLQFLKKKISPKTFGPHCVCGFTQDSLVSLVKGNRDVSGYSGPQ
jgi:hypothetical protein